MGVLENTNAIDAFDFWGETNDCRKGKKTSIDNSNLYATHTYLDCIDNATVKLVQVFNSGHWPYLGINTTYIESMGEIPENMITVDTTQLSWDFCSPYQLEVAPTLLESVPYVSPYILKPSSDGAYL